MADGKKSFVLYSDLISVIKKLVDKDRVNGTNYAGELFLHILEYVNDNEPIPIDFVIEMAFEPIKLQLKRDLDKWGETREGRSKAGKASAEARRLKKEQELTNSTNVKSVQQSSTNPTVNANVTVTVNDSVIKEDNSTTAKAVDYPKLLEYINTTFTREFRIINESIKTKYKARIKEGYTKKDIITAIDNCRKDKYHIETNFKYCTPEFFSRSLTIDKYSSTTKGQTAIQPQKFETLQDVKNLWQ